MNNLSISGGITFLSSLICAFFIFFAPPRNLLKTIWSFFGLTVSLWGLGLFFAFLTPNETVALFWLRYLNIVAVLIPIFFFHFVLIFTEHIQKKKNELFLYYAMVIIFFLATILFPTQFVKSVSFKYPFAFYPDPGLLYYVFPVIFGFLVLYGVILLIKELYSSKNVQKINQIKYFLLGVAIGFGGGSTTFFYVFNINIYPWGTFLVPMHVITVTYATLKYSLMDIRIAVTKGGIFLVVFAFILGIPFWLGHSMLHSMPFWYVPIGLMAILASLGPLIYRKLDAKAEDIILAEQRRYQRILVQAANGMTNERNLPRLLKLIVYVICKTVNIEFAAIFLRDKESGMYKLSAIRDHKSVTLNTELPENDLVIELIKAQKEQAVDEKAVELMQRYINKPVGLVVPAFMNEKLIGLLVLGEKRNKKMYNQDDINVFRILTDQASLAIANCLYMDQVKKSQEQLFQAEKLANVGGMAEGVAHQIKNRLNSFSMAAGEQEYEVEELENTYKDIIESNPGLKDSLSFIKSAAKSVIENVVKVNGIITGILNYAKVENKEALFLENDIMKMLDSVKEWVQIKHELGELPIILDIKNDGKLYGVETQLTEAIFNMVDNSYEAIKEKTESLRAGGGLNGYKPEILFSMFDNPVEKATVIRIVDNGIGIKDDVQKKIFAPFFTTKPSSKSGSGIGMYIVRRMIEENHRGRIWFNSTYNEGTEVFIKLPRKGALQ